MTNDEFQERGRAGEYGDQFVMLIDGEVIHRPYPSPPHDCSVSLTDYLLKSLFGVGYWVRIHMILLVGDENNPMPDVAVMFGSPRDYPKTSPRTAVMVVEVLDGSFAMDAEKKPPLYAAAGVPEYWVLDVNGRQLLVFRDPVADADAPRGFRYATTTTLAETDVVSPLAVPGATVRVAELLP